MKFRMTDSELLDWTKMARVRAGRGGSMHPLWDLIFDVEAHVIARDPSASVLDRGSVEAMVAEYKAGWVNYE